MAQENWGGLLILSSLLFLLFFVTAQCEGMVLTALQLQLLQMTAGMSVCSQKHCPLVTILIYNHHPSASSMVSATPRALYSIIYTVSPQKNPSTNPFFQSSLIHLLSWWFQFSFPSYRRILISSFINPDLSNQHICGVLLQGSF